MPYLQEVSDIWTSQGLVFLSIDIGESANKVSGYAARNKMTFTVLLDTKSEVGLRYGVMALPTTILIGRDGKVLQIKVGAFVSRQEIETKFLSLVFPELVP